MKTQKKCAVCRSPDIERGRDGEGKRAYRCRSCAHTWTEGGQSRGTHQRIRYQFPMVRSPWRRNCNAEDQ